MIKTYKILFPSCSPTPRRSCRSSNPGSSVGNWLKKKLLGEKPMEETGKFATHFGQYDLIDWQAEYVQLFDTGRSVSLYLFEHLKGDSKDRGQAMVDLIERVQK